MSSSAEKPSGPRERQVQKVCLKPALRQQVVPDARQSPPALHLSPNPGLGDQSRIVQAANTLILSAFDRECLNYLQNSTLVILLGKHWPWSTIAYAYTRIAVTEPMVMSMMLASTAREIHRMRRYDQGEHFVSSTITDQTTDLDGRMHYGRALSSLRVALRSEVKSPQKIEAIFITLWLMIDYENRFGGGASAIDIHTRGIESLLLNHVIPCLQTEIYRPFKYLSNTSSVEFEDTRVSRHPQPDGSALKSYNVEEVTGKPKELPTTSVSPSAGLGKTSVPLFLLWTLYFFTPTSWSFSSATGELDLMTFEFFLDTNGSHHKAPFPLAELYRISRQSPARFWGDSYTMTARMDDLENVAPLTLYHQSHILQFKITEQYKRGVPTEPLESGLSAYQKLVDEINSIATEHDTVLASVTTSESSVFLTSRRIIETSYWATITFYSTIVFYHLCFRDITTQHAQAQAPPYPPFMSLTTAVSLILDLSLKLYRSKPHLIVRITWPLFLAGVATSDQIYQDWVSIRLRELGRFGQNFARISQRFDEIIKGGKAGVSGGEIVFSLAK
ncbi:hypothetical protein PDE_07123 [Penicillium oxalicum 114-2]|uniref:Transcription factor domain-containing protein n=1 Tax=Penicillium oxalicum (strain 114-2 / CGMCC 5302) TaxID=933388 RepID=S8B091_PENO1|nr:hypothetical protein PDE_07123 [Penicillium oxalicum 114-2]